MVKKVFDVVEEIVLFFFPLVHYYFIRIYVLRVCVCSISWSQMVQWLVLKSICSSKNRDCPQIFTKVYGPLFLNEMGESQWVKQSSAVRYSPGRCHRACCPNNNNFWSLLQVMIIYNCRFTLSTVVVHTVYGIVKIRTGGVTFLFIQKNPTD